MLDDIENTLQSAVLLICSLIAFWRAFCLQSRTWTLLGFFFGSWLLGDLYWTFSLLFYGWNPTDVSVVSDLSWYASYIFLYILLRHAAPPPGGREKRILPWLGFLFTLGMGVYFCTFYIQWNEEQGYHFFLWEKALNNLIYAVLMGLLLFSAIRRLLDRDRDPSQRGLPAVILIFCLLEYGLWTASCFWWDESLLNPYYWFDFLVTVSFFLFLPAVNKAVKA